MLEELLIRHGAPTLAGLKTANMFNCEYADEKELLNEIRSLNHRIKHKGVVALPLRFSKDTALIYLFRPDMLMHDFEDELASDLLESQGYCCDNPGCCIAKLARRLGEVEFPHEIGLFLGYPPEDVSGFIENRQCKFCGFWKVYGDVEMAKRTFAKYRKCMNIYLDVWKRGVPVEKLAVNSIGRYDGRKRRCVGLSEQVS